MSSPEKADRQTLGWALQHRRRYLVFGSSMNPVLNTEIPTPRGPGRPCFLWKGAWETRPGESDRPEGRVQTCGYQGSPEAQPTGMALQ